MAANKVVPINITADGIQAVSGVVAALPISKIGGTGLTGAGILNVRIDVNVVSVTVVGAITVALQNAGPGDTFVTLTGTGATATVTAPGIVSLRQNIEVADNQVNMPLKSLVRAVLTTTNAGDKVFIDRVVISQAT